MKLTLKDVWEKRLVLYAKANGCWREGTNLRSKNNTLCAEGEKLHAKATRFWAEADELWAESILKTFGNIGLEWKNWKEKYKSCECHLENGEIYSPDLKRD